MKEKWFLVVAGILFTCLVAYRAVIIPVTHDEASTWLNFRHLDVWSCVSEYRCWQTANNHWLNTLLMQWSASLFGEKVWALRLPNILAGALYFLAAVRISSRYIASPLLQFSGFLLLSSHVFLLDFFSLFRGYGMMVSGVIWGVYCLLRYSDEYHARWLFFCLLAMVLAVLSNFTALLPLAALGTTWFVLVLLNKRFSLVIKHGLIWIVLGGLLGALIAYPLRILNDAGEFGWGSQNLWAMTADLTINLLYGYRYLGERSYALFAYILTFVICVVGFCIAVTGPAYKKTQLYIAFGLLLSNIVVMVIYQKITGALLPIGRKSVYLVPVIFTPLALALNLVKQRTLVFSLCLVVSGMMLFHTFRPHLWSSCREWYYDAYYPELFSATLFGLSAGDSIRLGSSWIFYPALEFYHQTQSLPINGLIYQRPLVIDSSMDYYYVEQPDTAGMYSNGFVLEKNIGHFFLFKKTSASSLSPQRE